MPSSRVHGRSGVRPREGIRRRAVRRRQQRSRHMAHGARSRPGGRDMPRGGRRHGRGQAGGAAPRRRRREAVRRQRSRQRPPLHGIRGHPRGDAGEGRPHNLPGVVQGDGLRGPRHPGVDDSPGRGPHGCDRGHWHRQGLRLRREPRPRHARAGRGTEAGDGRGPVPQQRGDLGQPLPREAAAPEGHDEHGRRQAHGRRPPRLHDRVPGRVHGRVGRPPPITSGRSGSSGTPGCPRAASCPARWTWRSCPPPGSRPSPGGSCR